MVCFIRCTILVISVARYFLRSPCLGPGPRPAKMAFTNTNGLVKADNNSLATTDHDVLSVPTWKQTAQEFIVGTQVGLFCVVGEEEKIAWSRIWYIMGHACQGIATWDVSIHNQLPLVSGSFPILLRDLTPWSLTSPWNSSWIRNEILLQ